MPESSLTIEQVLALLAESPRRIAALTADLPPDLARVSPAPDAWSANDVLAHLRACADVWGGCIATIIAEDQPTIRAVNPRTWLTGTNYLDLAFQPSFDAYAAQRGDLLSVLRALPPESWAREATVTGAGKPLQRTVHVYAQWLAKHEGPHVKQIARIVETLAGA